MKFATTALLLGCSALAYEFAVQSDLFHNLESHLPNVADARQLTRMFDRLAFRWPIESMPAVDSTIHYSTAPRIQLSRSEALALIDIAAAKHRVAASFVKSIIAAESNFDPNAVSPRGAIGLMQLMPDTARMFNADPSVPAQNIDAGTHYLRVLMTRYQKSKNSMKRVIAAYNAGPGNVDRYRGVPPFKETRVYVSRVLGFLHRFEFQAKRTARG